MPTKTEWQAQFLVMAEWQVQFPVIGASQSQWLRKKKKWKEWFLEKETRVDQDGEAGKIPGNGWLIVQPITIAEKERNGRHGFWRKAWVDQDGGGNKTK